MEINVISAIQDSDNGIGFNGDQPYSFKKDFEEFVRLTKEKFGSVIMGRITWESIPERFRPLDDRLNIVVTRNKDFPLPEGVLRAESYEHAKKLAADNNPTGPIWNIGGGQLYREAIQDPETRFVYITRIFGNKTCDVFFPKLEGSFKRLTKGLLESGKNRLDKQEYAFLFEKWERK